RCVCLDLSSPRLSSFLSPLLLFPHSNIPCQKPPLALPISSASVTTRPSANFSPATQSTCRRLNRACTCPTFRSSLPSHNSSNIQAARAFILRNKRNLMVEG